MSGHEFEKQVRQTLDDLKLVPTAKVWENIEEGLRHRRRRPAAIYWLPALLLGLSAIGYFLITTPQNHQPVAQVTSPKEANRSVATKSAKQTNLQHRNDDQSLFKEEIEQTTPPQNPVNAPSRITTTDQKTILRSEEQTHTVNDLPQADALHQTNSTVKSLAPQETQTPYEISLKHTQPNLIVESQHVQVQIPINQYTYNAEGTNKVPGKKIKALHWSYGLQSSAGISAVNEGKLLGFNNARVEDVSTVAPFAPQQPYQPSSISPGFTYSVGAFVQKDLSKKLSLSVGLNYLQVNTHNKVGSEINSRAVVNNGTRGYIFVPSYFTIDRDYTTEYRNRYHFIEVPVIVHTRINKSKKLPISANTGIAVSRLIKSNSLHFDGTTGVYYQNDKLLNRTQLAANVGLSFGILNKTTRPIEIGPSVRYNVSKILEKDVSTRKNFMSFGIDARMFIR